VVCLVHRALVVKRKKKFLMKYEANGLCQLLGVGALSEYNSYVYFFFVLFICLLLFYYRVYSETKLCKFGRI